MDAEQSIDTIIDTYQLLGDIPPAASKEPTPVPSKEPTPVPSKQATPIPSKEPTPVPSKEPTPVPSKQATPIPSKQPTPIPSKEPTPVPSKQPTPIPSKEPTPIPSKQATPIPSKQATPMLSKEPTPIIQPSTPSPASFINAEFPKPEEIIQENNKEVNNMSSDQGAYNNITVPNLPALLSSEYLAEKILQQAHASQHLEAVNNLLNHISTDKEKTNDKLFIISAAYDKVYKKFNNISLCILILSSIVTLIEAFRLSILEFVNNNPNIAADTYIISFTMNIITLSIGTVITILSSIIRFKNYREILEQLKDKQNLLIGYREKYSKKYEKLLNLLAFDNLTKEDLVSINEKIIEYDNDIKTINVMEYLRNEDIIRFNKYKAYFDFQIRKINIDKEIAIQRYETRYSDKLTEIQNAYNNDVADRHKIMKRLKEFFTSKKNDDMISQ
jgi:hypothetical protein